MDKRLLKYLRIIITICLLGLVVYLADLFSPEGRAVLYQTLKNADLAVLLLAVLVGIVINMVSTFKWYMLARSQQLGAGFWRMFAYYLVGQFYNMFLPTSVGGDVIRAYELGRYSGRPADSMASVFVERYTGVVTLLLIAGLAVMSQLSRFNQDYILITLIVFSFGLGLIAWLILDPRLYQYGRNIVESRIKITSKLFRKVDSVLSSIVIYKQQPLALLMALGNSLVFYFFAVLNVYITALVFNSDVSFIDMLIATPIIMLIMNLPISFGNLGLMEVSYVSVLELMGYGAELGVAIMLLMRVKAFFDAALGGILHSNFVTLKPE